MKSGDWLWFHEGNSCHSVQLIKPTASGSWLVRTFWPTPYIPENIETLEIKTECSECFLPESVVIFHHSSLPEHTQAECDNFYSIRESLDRRNSVFENGLMEVSNLMESERFEEALELLNSVGPIQKRNPQIYLMRARCFRQLGDSKAAAYDYDFYRHLGGEEAL